MSEKQIIKGEPGQLQQETRTLTGYFVDSFRYSAVFQHEADALSKMATHYRCDCGQILQLSHVCNVCRMAQHRDKIKKMPEQPSTNYVYYHNGQFDDFETCCENVFEENFIELAEVPKTEDEYKQAILQWFKDHPQDIYCAVTIHPKFDIERMLDKFYEDCEEIEYVITLRLREVAQELQSILDRDHKLIEPQDVRVCSEELAAAYVEMWPFSEYQQKVSESEPVTP